MKYENYSTYTTCTGVWGIREKSVRAFSCKSRFITLPSGRGLVIRIFFGWSLAPDLCSVKTILAGNLRRLPFIRRIFVKVGVENYWRFNGIKIPLMKGRMKVLESFEAGMKSPNLPWHVNITSLKHRRRFGEVPCFCQVG